MKTKREPTAREARNPPPIVLSPEQLAKLNAESVRRRFPARSSKKVQE